MPKFDERQHGDESSTKLPRRSVAAAATGCMNPRPTTVGIRHTFAAACAAALSTLQRAAHILARNPRPALFTGKVGGL